MHTRERYAPDIHYQAVVEQSSCNEGLPFTVAVLMRAREGRMHAREQHLQEDVEDVRVRLLDLIHQHHRKRPPSASHNPSNQSLSHSLNHTSFCRMCTLAALNGCNHEHSWRGTV